ncbi:hypothetical protein GCM10018955_55170 [Planomonospora venezuelensis]
MRPSSMVPVLSDARVRRPAIPCPEVRGQDHRNNGACHMIPSRALARLLSEKPVERGRRDR